MPVKLIVGCGYLGGRVAELWLADGHAVAAISRSATRAAALRERGIDCRVADVLRPDTLRSLPAAQTVLYAVGWDRAAGVSIGELYVRGLQNLLTCLPAGTSRFIYISSTGVFGQADGGWVDEQSECRPTRAGGVACLEAETALRRHPLGQQAIVLRMAGIYGPGRIPRLRDLQQGRPIAAPSQGFLNLIHVQDAARIVVAAERHVRPPGLLCVSDGHPVVRGEYYRELARLAGTAEPRFTTPPADAPATERSGSSKRVSNRLLLQQVPIRLQYPSYREGLRKECADQGLSAGDAEQA
jgi:nucleoside-diphosphate-sugar epimerase